MITTTPFARVATLAAIAALLGACERNPAAPTTSFNHYNDSQGQTLSAPAAPSLAGTPIADTPETHRIAVAPPAPDEPTARDTTANRPMATMDEQKSKTEQPLGGHVNSFMSDSQQAGRNEASDAVPIDGKPSQPAS